MPRAQAHCTARCLLDLSQLMALWGLKEVRASSEGLEPGRFAEGAGGPRVAGGEVAKRTLVVLGFDSRRTLCLLALIVLATVQFC